MAAKSGERSVGIQTSVPFREYVGPKERAAQAPEFFKEGWMHRPKTVSTLCVFLAAVFVAAQVLAGHETTLHERLAWGVLAAACMFVVFGSLQLPDGLLVRPTPFVWRFVKSCSVLYLVGVVFLLFQDLEDVRSWLHSIDPQSGVPIEETNYANACGLGAVPEKLDIFVLAHFGGWFVKALVIRDTRLLWVLSVLFEAAEISLRHVLPNFWECWWDHLLLDVFGCNMLGIYLGLFCCRKLQVRSYHWHRSYSASLSRVGCALGLTAASCASSAGAPSQKRPLIKGLSARGKALAACASSEAEFASSSGGKERRASSSKEMRCLASPTEGEFVSSSCPAARPAKSALRWQSALFSPLTPYELRKYRWPGMLSSARSFVGLALFCFSVTLLDLNVFFLKAELHMPPAHPVILARTALVACAAAAGTSEFYAFLTDERCIRMGVQCWLDLAIIGTEALLAFKWYFFEGALQPHEPCPSWIKVFWTAAALVLVLVVVALSILSPSESSSNEEEDSRSESEADD